MPTGSREYIALRPLFEGGEADRLIETLRAWNEPRRRINYQITRLDDAVRAEAECLNLEAIEARGGFPCTYVNLTFDPDQVALAELALVEEAFGLAMFAESRSRVSYFRDP